MCNSGCSCCCFESTSTSSPSDEAPTPPPINSPIPQACTCSVIVHGLQVHDTGEASKGEWELTVNVNGQTKTWKKDGVVEKHYDTDLIFNVSNCAAPILLTVGGWELDPGGHSGGLFGWFEDNNDKLSGFSTQITAPDRDPSVLRAYQRRVSNETGDYTVYYEVVKTCETTRVLSKAAIQSAMKEYGASLKKHRKATLKAKTPEELTNAGLRKLLAHGWRVAGVTPDAFLLKGVAPVKSRVKAD